MATPTLAARSLLLIAVAACGSEQTPPEGTGGGAPSCTPVTETCDGSDEDCDGVPDDGPCSEPSIAASWFATGSGVDHVRGVAFDETGNLYLTGAVTTPADFGGGPIEGVHGYVASLDVAGDLRWVTLWGESSGSNYGQDVSVSGDLVCVSGAFAGSFDFGGGLRSASGYNDAFVLCLGASDGGYRWDRAFGGAQSDTAEGVHVASSGDVVVTGDIGEGSTDFGGGVVADAAGYFVARYASDGTHRWARTYAGAGADFGASPATDAAGNAYVVGHFNGEVDFGGGARSGEGAAFMLSLDAQGGFRWDRTTGPATTFYGVVARANDIVVAGDYSLSLSLGGEPMPGSEENRSAFAAAFGPDGQLSWQYAVQGPGGTRGFGIAVAPDGGVVLAGALADLASPGDVPRLSAGADDMLAVGLTAEGKYLWDVVIGGPDQDAANAVAIDATGRVVLGGETWGPLEAAGTSHTNGGSADAALLFLE